MKSKKSVRIAGTIFSILLVILFSIAAYMFYPKGTERFIDLSSREMNRAAGDKVYYTLEPGDYRVLDQFYEKDLIISSTKGVGRRVTHGYYSVLICDKNNEPLVVAVRVDKRRKDIGNDDSYRVLAMAADFPEDLKEKQDKAYTWDYPVADIILNDVSEMQSVPKAIIFAVFALVFFVVTVKIILNNKQYHD